jgi:very-short-patch-repair endonuclease
MKRRYDIDLDDLLQLYNSGMSVKQLSKHFGIARSGIVTRLHSLGITQRNRSEAMFLRMAQSSSEERARLSDAAHAAVRGKRYTFEERCNRAISREIHGNVGKVSRIENRFIAEMEVLGYPCIPQKAIGPYNVDIALAEVPVVVEIFGGNWHAVGYHNRVYRERFDYIFNSGYQSVIIWVIRDYPLEDGAIQYVISLADKISRGETVIGKEKVIRGDGNITTTGCTQLNYRPIISNICPRDHTTGRYTSRIPK